MTLRSKCSQVASFKGCLSLVALLLVGPARADDQKAEAATVTTSGAAAPAVITESQREAGTVLDRMATYLAGLQFFTVMFRAGYDVVQATGQKIEFGETRHITMARPNQLRVEEVTSDGNRDLALFDGRNMTVMNADSGVFAQAAQPDTVDDALVYFVRDLKMRMPLALLLTTRLPGELPKRVKTIDYVESSDVYGVPTHHIAGRTDTVDFQFWITEGEHPLPLRVVITYPQAEDQPQYWANFSDWNTSPALTKTTFQFTPPKDARQIAFAVQVPKPIGTPRPAAANGEIQP